jgi:uncharacterized protein (TIGR03000 family)
MGAPVMPGTVLPGPAAGKGGTPLPTPEPGKGGTKKDGKKAPTDEETSTGTIQVSLPAEARLTVDGRLTTSTSSSRTLISPNLEPGYDYFYTLRAEIVRDGQTLTQTQRVAVRAGDQTRVSFDFSPSGVASSR